MMDRQDENSVTVRARMASRLARRSPDEPFRWLLCAGCAMLLLMCAPLPVGAGQPGDAPSAAGVPAERFGERIELGLQWLAGQQAPDGSFGTLSHYGPHVGLTGLAGLAFMADGSSPRRGPYGDHIEKCVRFVVDHSSESGLLAAETSHGPMYGHGFATLFLAETYGMSAVPNLGEALRKAVRLIVATQNEEGGWRYQPMRQDADISVTVCQIMALRAARNAGIHVEKSVIDRAASYVKTSQNPDGGFRYMLSPGASAFARSAAGVAALQYSGVYRSDEIRRGLDFLMRFRPPTEQSVSHYFYGHYYAVQAMFVSGGERWQTWWPAVRAELLERQHADGYWKGQAGPEYGTAMALIVLQIPQGLLPIFQK